VKGGVRDALAALVICLGAALPARAEPAGSAASRNNEGNRLYDQKRYDEALKMYTDAQAARPEAPELHYNIGNVLYRKQEFDKATEEYLKAQSSSDRTLYQAAVFNRGNALLMQGRLQEAVGAYVQALRARPDDADAKRNLELALKLLQEQAQRQPQGGGPRDQQKPDQSQQQAGARQPQQDQEEPGSPQARRQQPRPGQMTEEEARQVLEALRAEEKEAIKKHARVRVPDRREPERDW
jgi:tetratricopeptide (TPR) repeat protein